MLMQFFYCIPLSAYFTQLLQRPQALLYLIYLLDPIVKGDYVIAYFHTLTSSNNYPSLQWLKDVYSILPYK